MSSSPTDSSGILNRHPRKVPRGVGGPALHATLTEILAWFDRHVTPYQGMVSGVFRHAGTGQTPTIVLHLKRGTAPFDAHMSPGPLREEYISTLADAVRHNFPALLAIAIRLPAQDPGHAQDSPSR